MMGLWTWHTSALLCGGSSNHISVWGNSAVDGLVLHRQGKRTSRSALYAYNAWFPQAGAVVAPQPLPLPGVPLERLPRASLLGQNSKQSGLTGWHQPDLNCTPIHMHGALNIEMLRHARRPRVVRKPTERDSLVPHSAAALHDELH